jgi:hypothetical protein
MLTPELGEALLVLYGVGVRESRFDFTRPVERFVESIAEAQLSFPYF